MPTLTSVDSAPLNKHFVYIPESSSKLNHILYHRCHKTIICIKIFVCLQFRMLFLRLRILPLCICSYCCAAIIAFIDLIKNCHRTRGFISLMFEYRRVLIKLLTCVFIFNNTQVIKDLLNCEYLQIQKDTSVKC